MGVRWALTLRMNSSRLYLLVSWSIYNPTFLRQSLITPLHNDNIIELSKYDSMLQEEFTVAPKEGNSYFCQKLQFSIFPLLLLTED